MNDMNDLGEHSVDLKEKSLENLILIMLGSSRNIQISMLHLEKEVFLLWNFHPGIRDFVEFMKHYRGPFSKEIQEAVLSPFFLHECWKYSRPRKDDKWSGGFVRITPEGVKKFEKLSRRMKEDYDLRQLLYSAKMLRELYDKLSPKEFLLLIYDTYPEYSKRSEVYREIVKEKKFLSLGLLEKNLIDEKRLASLLKSETDE
jgi:hypothetical protein